MVVIDFAPRRAGVHLRLMNIRKAVITAAHPVQRHLPLQTLVDRDGGRKSALQIILDEVVAAGIEEICVIICPGDGETYRGAAGPHAGRIHFLEQDAPRGYGHAVFCARSFVGAEPFLLLVSDHLYVSASERSCTQQLLETAAAEECAVSAVQATHESKLPFYGTVGGHLCHNRRGLYVVERVMEKPTPTEAEQHLIVPGLRAGHYLCFFGMHVLTPGLMELLGSQVAAADGKRVHLSPALAGLAAKEKYLAIELEGRRHDLDAKYGVFLAQLGLALAGRERAEVLAQLVELLAVNPA
jgi:UTP--glucose-1-phosphate uridylyltransferase